MPNITKPNDVNNVWAATGDIVAPAADYVANGWEAIIPPREYFNWLDNRQDRFNAHVNQHGIPVWDASTEYQANQSYSKGSDGKIYRAATTNSNVNPVGDTTGAWYVFGAANMRKFTANGSFVVPSGVTTIYISATAAGGGGGGGTNNGGGGGGGGAGRFALKNSYTVVPGATYAITIGIPGNGGVGGATGAAGQSGGNTVVGSLLTLQGGGGGDRGGPLGGGGGGTPGGGAGTDPRGYGGDGGSGASNPFGTGAGAGRAGSGTGKVGSGTEGFGYGAGGAGGGAAYGSATSSGNGTAGMPGIVIIEW